MLCKLFSLKSLSRLPNLGKPVSHDAIAKDLICSKQWGRVLHRDLLDSDLSIYGALLFVHYLTQDDSSIVVFQGFLNPRLSRLIEDVLGGPPRETFVPLAVRSEPELPYSSTTDRGVSPRKHLHIVLLAMFRKRSSWQYGQQINQSLSDLVFLTSVSRWGSVLTFPT